MEAVLPQEKLQSNNIILHKHRSRCFGAMGAHDFFF
jgi:hypothetical protein